MNEAMNVRGIILNRAFLEWEWIGSPEAVSLYIYLLLRASTKDNVICGQNISRGQVIILRGTLVRELGISVQKMTTALRRLQEGGHISIDKARRYYLITLNKYDEFAVSDLPQVH